MGLRILHSADWHMGSAFGGFSPQQRRFLRQQQLSLPGRIAELCRREGCDLVFLAGDIFDGIPGREAVDAVKKGLADCAVPVFVSPGNHDFCGVGSPWAEEEWPENVHVFKGGITSAALPELDCRIFGAGYSSMDCPPLLTHFRAQGEEKYLLGILHADPVNRQSPYCPVTAAQIQESGLAYLAVGHIHKTGSLRQGNTLCAWPGCPMGRGWDETGEKGVYLVEVDEHADIRFQSLGMPVFWDLEADVTDDSAAAVAAVLPAAESDDFFRITLTGAADVDPKLLESFTDRFPNLFFRDRTDPPVDLWADVEKDTFRGTYFRQLQELAASDETALLAAEISQRILSGREVALP